MIVSLDLARRYCRASTSDDALLTVLAEAAEGWAASFLNRKVFADQAAVDAAGLDAGTQPMIVNAQFTAAVLELVADRYDKRENGTANVSTTRAEKLLWPYRVGLGV